MAAYICRGIVYRRLGDHRKALRDETSAIELNPNNDALAALSHNSRGQDYVHLGNYREAIKDFDRAIHLDPKFPNFYYNRGIAYGKLGDQRQAIEDYKTAAKLGYKPAQDLITSMGFSW